MSINLLEEVFSGNILFSHRVYIFALNKYIAGENI